MAPQGEGRGALDGKVHRVVRMGPVLYQPPTAAGSDPGGWACGGGVLLRLTSVPPPKPRRPPARPGQRPPGLCPCTDGRRDAWAQCPSCTMTRSQVSPSRAALGARERAEWLKFRRRHTPRRGGECESRDWRGEGLGHTRTQGVSSSCPAELGLHSGMPGAQCWQRRGGGQGVVARGGQEPF